MISNTYHRTKKHNCFLILFTKKHKCSLMLFMCSVLKERATLHHLTETKLVIDLRWKRFGYLSSGVAQTIAGLDMKGNADCDSPLWIEKGKDVH